jgi:hypothetical protein
MWNALSAAKHVRDAATCGNLADSSAIPLDRAIVAACCAMHSGRSTQAVLSLSALSLSAPVITGRCDIETTCFLALRARRRRDVSGRLLTDKQ